MWVCEREGERERKREKEILRECGRENEKERMKERGNYRVPYTGHVGITCVGFLEGECFCHYSFLCLFLFLFLRFVFVLKNGDGPLKVVHWNFKICTFVTVDCNKENVFLANVFEIGSLTVEK